MREAHARSLPILLGMMMTGVSCCAPAEKPSRPEQMRPTTRPTGWDSAWYDQIEPRPATQKKGSIDPATGEEIRDFAEQKFPRPMPREVAFRILLNTETFADSRRGNGSSAKRPQTEAFLVALAQPDAVPAFTDLLRRAHPAGQLYALCGLRLWTPAKYAALEPEFAKSKVVVQSESGDVGSTHTVGELVKSPAPKTVQLLPGETLEEWEVRTNSFDGAAFDISGGGYPEEFLE